MHTKEYVPYTKNVNVQVQENKAPTDESIKMLNQMQNKAAKNILSHVTIDNDVISGVAVMIRKNMTLDYNCDTTVFVKFSINGKEFVVEYTPDITEKREIQDILGRTPACSVTSASKRSLQIWLARKFVDIYSRYIAAMIAPEILKTM